MLSKRMVEGLRNLLLRLAFDGAEYHGWQIQSNALTVQEVFQNALYKVIGETVDIKACSRTDTGVHSRDFCISFKTNSRIPVERMPMAINHFLPEDIAVYSCSQVDDSFHARYSCKGKEYVYEIWNAKIRDPFLKGHALHYWYHLDENLLNAAAQGFVGKHNFESFCTLDKRDKGDMERTVKYSEVRREDDKVLFTVAADGFLYNMVRIMAGTLLGVQQGKFDCDDIIRIIEARNRKCAGVTAPACALFLNKVFYDF